MAGLEKAKIIYSQMGGNQMRAMVGAYSMVGRDNGLTFKFKGCRKTNCLDIELDPSDTYNLKFWKITNHGLNCKVVKEIKGVYADQLREIFEIETGLRVSL